MLYLAQVQEKDAVGKTKLQLLAYQKAEYAWAIFSGEDNFVYADIGDYGSGALLLVQLSDLRQVEEVQDAAAWTVEIIQRYLVTGVTPDILQQEVQRAEQWRQSLTLQSQELGRRALEMEARRDQIQELEENLKREKKQLELERKQLELEKNQVQELLDLKSQRDQIQELEENLKREKKQLELERKQLELKAAQISQLKTNTSAS
jgi:chromosome segregation ATPase